MFVENLVTLSTDGIRPLFFFHFYRFVKKEIFVKVSDKMTRS